MFRDLRQSFRNVAIASALLFAGALFAQTTLTTVHDVRALSTDQAKAGRPVLLHGVVTTLSGWKNSFFFDDGTAGISVDRLTDMPATTQGESVEIHGHTAPGLFAPIVIAESVRGGGPGKLPEAHLYSAAELMGGSKDSQWVAVRGIVRTAEVKPLWGSPRLMLALDIGGGTVVTAVVHDFDAGMAKSLTSALVVVHGVCGTVFNGRRQFIGVRLFVADGKGITVERPAPQEPFDLPQRSLNTLMQFRNVTDGVGQIKVAGTVTWSKPGLGVYIQDGDQSLFVQSGVQDSVKIGSRVEAVGYPSLGTYSPQLENSIFEVQGEGVEVKPVTVPAAGMIVNRDGFTAVPYDSMLVTVKGKLLEQFVRGEEDVLLLQEGATVFTARIATKTPGKLDVKNNSVIAVTGVCIVTVDQSHEPRSFAVLMRSKADILVVQRAPWWTARHWATVAFVMLGLALALLGVLTFQRHEAGMRALVVTDALTGLYNRRGFLAYGQAAWQEAQRSGVPLLLFYIDLDLFKEINDTYGHQQGDVALTRVGTLLRESFRKSDVVGRLGGDEFAVAAVDSAVSVRASLEEKLYAALAHVNERAKLPFALQLSVGVITCEPAQSQCTIEDLLAQADRAMYEEKRLRRGARTRITDPEMQT